MREEQIITAGRWSAAGGTLKETAVATAPSSRIWFSKIVNTWSCYNRCFLQSIHILLYISFWIFRVSVNTFDSMGLIAILILNLPIFRRRCRRHSRSAVTRDHVSPIVSKVLISIYIKRITCYYSGSLCKILLKYCITLNYYWAIKEEGVITSVKISRWQAGFH